MNYNPLLIARSYASLSPSIRKLVDAGRILTRTHWMALRIGIRQLMAKVQRGRQYYIHTAQLTNLLNWVEKSEYGVAF